MGMVKHSQTLQCLYNILKKVRDEGHFLHVDKHEDIPEDFNTLSIKCFYKVIISLLMSMIKHSQST